MITKLLLVCGFFYHCVMQNTKYTRKIKEIYLESTVLNMKQYLKLEYFESLQCAPSKSISEDTIALFLFALLFNISRL